MNTKQTIYNNTYSENVPFITGECGTDRLQQHEKRQKVNVGTIGHVDQWPAIIGASSVCNAVRAVIYTAKTE